MVRGIAVGGILLLATSMMAGCMGRSLVEPPMVEPIPRLGPVEGPDGAMLESQAIAQRWYYGWVEQQDVTTECPVQDMLLVLSTRNREWRVPEGPDGYVLRAVLLDEQGSPTQAEGAFQAFAVWHPGRPDHEALYAWSIPPELAEQRYSGGMLPGYVLELDWGVKHAPPPPGEAMVVVRWQSGDGTCRLTRNVVFEDRIDYGIWELQERP
ncbi:MAG: hypothetical protein ACOC93_00560 [Planctomycetota bacterium]